MSVVTAGTVSAPHLAPLSAPPHINGWPVDEFDVAITALETAANETVRPSTTSPSRRPTFLGAETDADVYLVVNGTLGSTASCSWANGEQLRAQQDRLLLLHPAHHRTPTAAWVGFAPMCPRPDWLLKTVTISSVTFSHRAGGHNFKSP
jgi:hypothetical protein